MKYVQNQDVEGLPADRRLNEAGIRDRLAYVLDLFPSRKYAAEVAQKSVDQLHAYVKGHSNAPFDALARLCQAKDVSLDWLATGRGTPPADTVASRRPPGFGEAVGGDRPGWGSDFVVLPVRRALAGPGLEGGPKGGPPDPALAARAEWVTAMLRRNPESLFLVAAVGDGMAPTIRRGDVLLVDRSQRVLHDGGVFVLESAEELLVRRVARSVNGTLQIYADNPRYPAEHLSADDSGQLAVAGEVVWIGTVL